MLPLPIILIALGILLLVGASVIGIPGNLHPGIDCQVEYWSDTITITEADVEGNVAITLTGGYSAAPSISPSAGPLVTDGASTKIIRTEITARSATAFTIECELDIAPGAGKTTTITVSGTVTGPPKK